MKKIIANNTDVILLQEETKYFYIGFSLLSEDLVRLSKRNSNEISIPVLKLIGNEKAKFIMITHMYEHISDRCRILNISDRTYYRMQKDYNTKLN